ncbi:MAG TPA: PadR family transcriptional regulator [Anaerolineales bacterium]|nr:PadR family transcriptional regulator [Anaerolineales bacterium]HNA87953.1 PadR family transcriptional regulator [Anaerolineales bacterium]HNB35614.1 PadR family transcriptional regulator [Anaerolineales bacterium]HNC08899.1 PadR family transcriptional regulator [Anaerolineales bacterium]
MVELGSATKKFQKELNAGTSSLVLLAVLNRSGEPLYGYQIAKMLEESGPDIPMMKQGALYPVLRSLEENGLLESMVEPSVSGPPRRYYKITKDGRTALEEWTELWKQTKKFVDTTLKG